MKKVLFTSILLLSAVSFGGNIYAQGAAGGNDTEVTTPSATKPSVKFTAATKPWVKFTADGNTLTILGQGDLTSYTTTDWSAKVFTDNAVGFVFTDADGKTPVAAGESYNAGKTYYQADYKHTKVLEGGLPVAWQNGFAGVDVKQSWNEEKLGNLYYGYFNNWGEKNSITIDSKVTSTSQIQTGSWNSTNDSYAYKNMAMYFVCEGESNKGSYTFDELQSKQIRMITLAEFNDEYIKSEATYYVQDNASLFKSTDGGKTFVGLSPNVRYTWTPNDVFYKGTATYAEIENNEDFFGEKGKHSDYIQADNTPLSFNQLLLRKITEGSYEKVVFENKSSESCLIDATTIQNILFPNSGENTVIKELDLGQATLNNLSATHFGRTGDLANCKSLETLTLPLTNKTIVRSEKTNADVEKMVVPTNVIPEGYGYTGHHLKTIHVPEGYDRVGDEAFKGRYTITNVTLPTSLQLIGASAFENCTGLTSIVLNEGLENIGKEAFMGNSLVSVKFPSTLRIINDAAFATASKDPHITNIKLNAGLKYIGNSAFALENDESEGVLEIPASVRYIGPFAFNFRQYQDVYFYGETAPLMPLGLSSYKKDWGEGTGFSEHTLDGNSGFQPLAKSGLGDDINTGYANRENYKNGKAYFCIMHYPKSLSDKDRSTYTDIKRQYKTDPDKNQFHKDDVDGPDGTKGADIVGQEQKEIKFGHCTAGKRVNWGYQDTYLGEQYIWPSQAQFTRAYATASNGLCWDGVTKYPADDDIESYLTEDDIATLEYAGYKIGTGKGEYSKADLAKLAHIGTRQFVLANADSNVDKDEEKEPEYNIVMKPGQWWTLCVPFNMTRKQVLDTFGADTQLYFFYQVERHTTNGKNSILLKFTKDALNYSSTDDEGNKMKGEDGKWLYEQMEPIVGDDKVVIWAHESYMIKPMNGQDSDKDATFVVKNYAPVVGNPLPTIVDAIGTDQLQNDDYSKEYRFVGNYLGSTDNNKVVIPQYSYVYGKTTKDPTYKFRFYTGKTSVWKPNKSLVQSQDRQGGLRDYTNFFGADKSSTLPTSAKQASIFGEENFGETTGIDDVTIIAGNEVLTPIFTLDGKMVSANGSVDGLAKGVYVKAGKKFVVK
uniref:leucine-rich repeat domain-containing protein n=1 Tax=Prevotella sp. TaxID=59823 RepID=UPI004027C321